MLFAEYGLSEFPIEETFAKKIDTSIEESEIAKRRDKACDTLTFTIDPKDAKDFDDALHLKKLEMVITKLVFTLPMFRIICKKEQS
jgi:ribonuclease R